MTLKKKRKFFNLCGLITESSLEIRPFQYNFPINEFLRKVCTVRQVKKRTDEKYNKA